MGAGAGVGGARFVGALLPALDRGQPSFAGPVRVRDPDPHNLGAWQVAGDRLG